MYNLNINNVKQDFTLEIAADNNFSILNRIVNILNRRRIRIKKLIAHEIEGDFHRGGAILLLYTTPDTLEKIRLQLEKLIEVEYAKTYEGIRAFYDLSDKSNRSYKASA